MAYYNRKAFFWVKLTLAFAASFDTLECFAEESLQCSHQSGQKESFENLGRVAYWSQDGEGPISDDPCSLQTVGISVDPDILTKKGYQVESGTEIGILNGILEYFGSPPKKETYLLLTRVNSDDNGYGISLKVRSGKTILLAFGNARNRPSFRSFERDYVKTLPSCSELYSKYGAHLKP